MIETKTKDQLLVEFDVDPKSGLTSEEASERLSRDGKNKLPDETKKSWIKIFFAQMNDPMIYILMVAIVISIGIAIYEQITSGSASWLDAVVIFLVIIINAIIGTVQEMKAENALDALKKLSAPICVVRRNGELHEIKAEDLVVGDIVILEEGRTVPADLRLLESVNLKADESSLLEMQFFVAPGTDDEWFNFWKAQRIAYYEKMGIRADRLRWDKHGDDELAFYAKEAYDIQYLFPMGWQELEGIHNRTDYDLTQHQTFSGKDLTYLDQETKERYTPYVVETSAGLTRNVLMALSDAYEEQLLEDGETRTVMHFHPAIAPITVAVLPLVKKDGIAEFASTLEKELREDFTTFFDQSGAIGRRYRRMDEIGTPYCLTVDYQTLEDNTVTLL